MLFTHKDFANLPTVDGAKNFRLGSRRYLARPIGFKRSRPNINGPEKVNDISLATCFRIQKNQTIDADHLRAWRYKYLDQDDTFHPAFLQEVIFSGTDDAHLEADTEGVFEDWKTLQVSFVPNLSMPNGPCYMDQDSIYPVWRIYEDRQLAFLQSTWPSLADERTFVEVNAAGNGYRGHGIAVPARFHAHEFGSSGCHDNDQSHNLLRGLRVAVKDNYHLRGTRTSLGNRAYYENNPVQNVTAVAVSRLIDAGAYIVGKAHLSAFAMMEHPTQSVDYQAPFNPRGDGYLITGGSSGGNAAAVAAYDWLDLSLCSDTTGSSRIPALQNGVFGFRPSTHTIPTEGLVKDWAAVDTPALLGRDLLIFPTVVRVLQKAGPVTPLSSNKSSFEIIYPKDFMPEDNPEQVNAMEDFIKDMSRSAGCGYRLVSIQDDWQATAPVGEKNLQEYLYSLTRHGWFYSAYRNFEDFRQQYSATHGHLPFVTEVVRWYWRLGSQVDSEQHAEMMKRLSVFKDWFLQRYGLGDMGNNIVAIHIDTIKPKHRDEYPGNSNPEVPGLRPTYLSAILGAPEIAIPITQLPYQSRITDEEEMLPMVVSLMGAPGTDMRLLNWTIESLRRSGRPTEVSTGKLAFDT